MRKDSGSIVSQVALVRPYLQGAASSKVDYPSRFPCWDRMIPKRENSSPSVLIQKVSAQTYLQLGLEALLVQKAFWHDRWLGALLPRPLLALIIVRTHSKHLIAGRVGSLQLTTRKRVFPGALAYCKLCPWLFFLRLGISFHVIFNLTRDTGMLSKTFRHTLR